jgi:putative aldouronate transport system substrate-binding protein
MRYLNWLARFENNNFLQVGPEGITHDIVDGIPKIKAGTGLWIQNSPQNIDYTIPINGLDLGDPDKNARALVNSYVADPQLIIDAYNYSMANSRALPVVPVVLTAAGPYTETLGSKSDQILVNSIMTSPANFDKTWDEGIADWLASGAQLILDERKAKYIAP